MGADAAVINLRGCPGCSERPTPLLSLWRRPSALQMRQRGLADRLLVIKDAARVLASHWKTEAGCPGSFGGARSRTLGGARLDDARGPSPARTASKHREPSISFMSVLYSRP